MDAVIPCVNYGDFLAHTLPRNRPLIDRIVVVTEPSDRETIDVCRANGVDIVATDAFRRHNSHFNRGRGINCGLEHLAAGGWTAIMDADIVLPEAYGDSLDPRKVYGISRDNVMGVEDCQRYLHGKPFTRERIPNFYQSGNFVPTGFFQLYHRGEYPERRYPEGSGDASCSDVQFANQWSGELRELLPSVAIHLATDPGHGVNWCGRRSPRVSK